MIRGGTARKIKGPGASQQANTFVSCSAATVTRITNALDAVIADAPAVQALADGANDSKSWTAVAQLPYFFGPFDATRLGTVQSVTGTVTSSSTGYINFDCTGTAPLCRGGTNFCANSPSTIAGTCGSPNIYICPLFNTQKNYTDDHVVYHELAHWDGTVDNAYGCKASAALATSNTAEAISNADNYAWYATLVIGEKKDCGLEHLLFIVPLIGLLSLGMGLGNRRRLVSA